MKKLIWDQLEEIGVFICNVLPFTKEMELIGKIPRVDFFLALPFSWKFTHPNRFFIYTGGASVPVGNIDSADAYVGTAVDSIGDLLGFNVVRNGTVGGLFSFSCGDDKLHVITAGHCAVDNSELPSID